MKGIVLLSHGSMAKGVYETTKWFMGENIEQYTYICLEPTDKMEDFDNRIAESIKQVDSGEGVILFVDLFGGTPCNRCMQFMSDSIDLIAGMNLVIVLEYLGNRLSDCNDIQALMIAGTQGIVHVNTYEPKDSNEDFLD